jgi:hypothetical protein
VTDTLGALIGVNFVDFLAKVNGLIGALWLAHIAVDALVSNDQRHIGLPKWVSKKFKREVITHIIDASRRNRRNTLFRSW